MTDMTAISDRHLDLGERVVNTRPIADPPTARNFLALVPHEGCSQSESGPKTNK
jgi:hypothetical protein